MKLNRRTLTIALAAASLASLLPVTALAQKKIVLGFAQVGAESEWRTANTESIKSAAKEAGIELKFSDAQQKQENQIKAIRSFIAQKVDVIAFSPVVESGWETVLREAKAAKIPVVLTDRSVNTKDDSLYVTFMGSDFVEEGRKAGRWLVEKMKGTRRATVNIVELQGTVGSAPAIDRKKGFEEIIKADPKFKIIRSQTGDFTRAKGKEVMEAFLKAEGKKINVLYAHNDDMAIGAIQAIEEAGMKPAQGHHHHLDRRGEGRLRGHDRRQAQRVGRMQPAAGPAADERGEGHQGRQADAEAHRHRRRHLPDGSGRQGIPEAQVLSRTTPRRHCHETHFLKTLLAGCRHAASSASRRWPRRRTRARSAISMPTKSSARWIADGDNMVKYFKEKGYKTDLQYADDDIPNQLAQIENMVTKGAKVLVIAAIDGTTLSDVLQKAADKGVKVIAYDRLIKGSKNVDYYATFDNFQVGVLQAQLHRDRRSSLKEGKGPFNIELFGGSPDDNNAFFFYNGAMSVLKPYIDSGKLVVRSKQTGHGQGLARCAGTARWRRRAWTTCCRPTTPRTASMRCCRPMTACRSASSPRSRAWATARRSSRCRW